jgi:hypothetical protein
MLFKTKKINPTKTENQISEKHKRQFKNPIEEFKKLFAKITNNDEITIAPIKITDSKFKGIKTQDIKISIQKKLEELTQEFTRFEQYIKKNQAEKNDIQSIDLLFQMKGYTNNQIKEHRKYTERTLKFLGENGDRKHIIDCATQVERHIKSKEDFMNSAKKLYETEKNTPNKKIEHGKWYQIGDDHFEAKF